MASLVESSHCRREVLFFLDSNLLILGMSEGVLVMGAKLKL